MLCTAITTKNENRELLLEERVKCDLRGEGVGSVEPLREASTAKWSISNWA